MSKLNSIRKEILEGSSRPGQEEQRRSGAVDPGEQAQEEAETHSCMMSYVCQAIQHPLRHPFQELVKEGGVSLATINPTFACCRIYIATVHIYAPIYVFTLEPNNLAINSSVWVSIALTQRSKQFNQ